MLLLAGLIGSLLGAIGFTALINALTFPRLRGGSATPYRPPRVSLLVPARNEARVIGRTVTTLLAQTYPNFDLLILDDGSDDGTAELALRAAAGDPRCRVVSGAPLPQGWLGKNWACHQLSQQTDADLLIFTDADVDWRPNALTALVDLQQRTQADLLTVWPTQKTVTWAERLTVPNIALAIMAYLPLFGVHRLPFAIFAAANGQCMTFRRAAYDAVGGHAAVRARIVEDVALARLIKRSGQRLRMADGNEQINCRMYHNWPEVRDGLAKNIREGHGGTVMLLFSTLFHWLLFLLPWLWLGFGRKTRGWPKLPLLLTAISVGVRALAAKATRQRVRDALLMPVSVLLFTRIAARSIWWHWRGTVRWKGRTLS